MSSKYENLQTAAIAGVAPEEGCKQMVSRIEANNFAVATRKGHRIKVGWHIHETYG